MGNNPGWWHCKQEKKTKKQQNPHIPEAGRQEAAEGHTSPQILSMGHLQPNLWFTVNPFTHLLQAWKPRGSLWAGKSHLAGGIWGGIQPLLPQGAGASSQGLGKGGAEAFQGTSSSNIPLTCTAVGQKNPWSGSRPGLGTKLILGVNLNSC